MCAHLALVLRAVSAPIHILGAPCLLLMLCVSLLCFAHCCCDFFVCVFNHSQLPGTSAHLLQQLLVKLVASTDPALDALKAVASSLLISNPLNNHHSQQVRFKR